MAACSSAGDPPAADSTAAEASTSALTTVPSTAPPSTASAPAPTDAPVTWCDAAREVEEASDAVDTVDFADPIALERAMSDLVELTESALDVAPADLVADVRTTLDGMIAFRDELAAVDYEFLEADLAVLADPDGTLEAAGDRIEQYNFAECGIALDEPDESDEDPTFDPDAGTLRDQIIATLVATGLTVEEAECLFAEIDFADRSQTEDRELIAAAFEACGIDADEIES